jgi:undecaprenyl pyrophosphate synthase
MGSVLNLKDVKVRHRTTNHVVYIDQESGRTLKISVNHEKGDYIVHGVHDALKEVQEMKFTKDSIDKDIHKLDELHTHIKALLIHARNFGNMEIECIENGFRKEA